MNEDKKGSTSPDGDAQKYSTIQLAPGKGDILDFLTGPSLFFRVIPSCLK
jgi:hypothetical protein